MTISVVGTATAYIPTAGSGSQVINLPGGMAADDLVVVYFGSYDYAAPSLVTTGYTTQATLDYLCGNRLLYKKMGGTPDTTLEVNKHTTAWRLVQIWVLRGVDTTTPSDAAVTTTPGGSGAPDGPSITTVTNNAWVLSVNIDNTDGVGATAAPSGYSNLLAVQAGVFQYWAAGAWKQVNTAGAENPGAFTSTGSHLWDSMTWAVRPAAGGGGVVGTPFSSPVIRGARRIGRVIAGTAIVIPTLHQILHYSSKVI